MLRKRGSEERGVTETDWLTSRHTFSFNRYRDREWNGFSTLRVINEDTVAPGNGFDTHSHSNMEIITYVTEGSLHHEDSTGTDGVIEAGEVQRMTAGTGVLHSEYNNSEQEPLHLYQIWIEPAEEGLEPGYEKLRLEHGEGKQVQCIASPRGEGMQIHQDAEVFHVTVPRNESFSYDLAADRGVWIHVVSGDATVEAGDDAVDVEAGDGVAVEDVDQFVVYAETGTELLLFDLPPSQ